MENEFLYLTLTNLSKNRDIYLIVRILLVPENFFQMKAG